MVAKAKILPDYFNFNDGFHWFAVGDRIYGMITVRDVEVSYRFNDGSKPYEESRQFRSVSAAQRFAARFAAEMRRCDSQNSVPLPRTFLNFK